MPTHKSTQSPKTTKSTKTIKRQARKGRTRHPTWKTVFHTSILETVIRPALAEAADVPLTSIGDYYNRFQEHHHCSVSLAQFKSWLRDLNLIHYFQGPRQITPFAPSNPFVSRPDPDKNLSPDLAARLGLVSPVGGDDLVFDNERPDFVPPELRHPQDTSQSPPTQLPVELELALRGGAHPITQERPRTVIPGFNLQLDDPTAGTLNLPGLTS
jgi:hypothetical protein